MFSHFFFFNEEDFITADKWLIKTEIPAYSSNSINLDKRNKSLINTRLWVKCCWMFLWVEWTGNHKPGTTGGKIPAAQMHLKGHMNENCSVFRRNLLAGLRMSPDKMEEVPQGTARYRKRSETLSSVGHRACLVLTCYTQGTSSSGPLYSSCSLSCLLLLAPLVWCSCFILCQTYWWQERWFDSTIYALQAGVTLLKDESFRFK